ncbi:hypothetical protein XH89_39845 (plasmid) [Bradyrhizobium sp. CCBAU 53340]|uniref:Uncharacterized protein n=1 Tax=Bradyrhizobium guangzhouense TaxID=1325095 RepID=A0AAE5X8Z0_9BRAD|nr:hypothetical protein XH91_36415 [Bradyrhizobium guangzhouense]QOZ49615.1 hypothetical protein XH89_39845 [Bradyrhizobium sp. CCBAU 53340]
MVRNHGAPLIATTVAKKRIAERRLRIELVRGSTLRGCVMGQQDESNDTETQASRDRMSA